MDTRQINSAAFSARLRDVLLDKHLTRNQAAERLGIPGSQLSRYLNGQLPDLRMLYKLAQWSGHTMEWLLVGETEVGPSYDSQEAVEKKFDRVFETKEESRLAEITDLCERLAPDTLLAVQRLLEIIGSANSDVSLQCLRALTELLELETTPSSTIRPQTAAKLLTFFEHTYIEKLSHLDQAAFWDVLGKKLYGSRDASLATQSYTSFVRDLAKQRSDEDKKTAAQAVTHIEHILTELRKGAMSASEAIDGLIKTAEPFPQSPVVESRSNWRKSAALKDRLRKTIAEAISHKMDKEEWGRFCKIIRLQVLGR